MKKHPDAPFYKSMLAFLVNFNFNTSLERDLNLYNPKYEKVRNSNIICHNRAKNLCKPAIDKVHDKT